MRHGLGMKHRVFSKFSLVSKTGSLRQFIYLSSSPSGLNKKKIKIKSEQLKVGICLNNP